MAKTSVLLRQYARMGALTRLNELRTEIEAIESAFPDLALRRGPRRVASPVTQSAGSYTDDGQTAGPGEAGARTRKRKPMTAAQRKAVGERMRKYWAARRKAASR